jgi:N-acetylmannosamine-6-phosphate 2-epimerase / N-acetylmannosamine kinase
MTTTPLFNWLAHGLIVSCQAPDEDPFHSPAAMAAFAEAASRGGAAGIRANSAEDIAAIRRATDLPVIGIQKRMQADGRVLITPSFEDAQALVAAGAAIIALDCTERGCRTGALERLRRIRTELEVPVMADIATIEEGVAAAEAGADIVASTMRGYTDETAAVREFEPAFITGLASRVGVPVIAEGRVGTPAEAASAIRAGAFAVVVGTAITRPQAMAELFAGAVAQAAAQVDAQGREECLVGIDLGGTNTKSATVAADGSMAHQSTVPTPAGGGREVLLAHLKQVAVEAVAAARASSLDPYALGIATAGWVDPASGRVAYATGNLPGWTGTPIADELSAACGLPVAVENDANALAVAERRFGLGRECDNFVCITLGTGVGGGCYNGGRLNRGAHFFANALGHIPIQVDGLACNCGGKGCLEVYSNAAALMRYAGPGFANAEEVVRAANANDGAARRAVETLAGYLAVGVASIVHLLDPALVIVSGGLAQNNAVLIDELRARLDGMLIAARERRLEVRASELGYHGGVLGAAAVAWEKFLPTT